MRFPSTLIAAVVAGLVVALQYLLGHLAAFGFSDLLAPIVAVVLTTVIKAVQEWNPTPPPEASIRGFAETLHQASFAARVLYK